jgi:hypothetical protein
MAVMMPREKRTDHRLDDLNQKVDDGFESVDERFKEVDKRFDKVEGKINALDGKFDKKFDRLTFWILASAAGIITTLISILGAVIGPSIL